MEFCQLAEVQGCIGERLVEIRQLAKIQELYWRKISGRLPMAKVRFAKVLLANIWLLSKSTFCVRVIERKSQSI